MSTRAACDTRLDLLAPTRHATTWDLKRRFTCILKSFLKTSVSTIDSGFQTAESKHLCNYDVVVSTTRYRWISRSCTINTVLSARVAVKFHVCIEYISLSFFTFG
ncbi:hypothetical protein AHF37_03289 [Paragonimus kellicotti]|nr:hypothetical protein AHF37_03289 [Paragonimus kellicotti]